MKTIGLIGGMSWESTVTYYQQLNQLVSQKLGGLHSAKILLASVDFDEIEKCQSQNEWEKSGEILAKQARNLEKAGADFILICTNTMHKVADQVQQAINIPLLHIADATITELKKQNISKIGLLGTKYTLKQDFYKQRIIDSGIDVIIPSDEDIEIVNDIIFNELVLGKIKTESKKQYLEIIEKMREDGAQGIILGCTEIGLLIESSDTDLPVFDTTLIHSRVAVEKALQE
jgi:aspartate racemase